MGIWETVKILERIGIAVALFLVGVYVADYLSIRFRIPARDQFGTVRVNRVYAVRLKNRKTEFMPAESVDQRCVHSLFPHFGYAPCWYLNRHKEQEIQVGAVFRDPRLRGGVL